MSGIYPELWKVSGYEGRFKSVFKSPSNSNILVTDFISFGHDRNRKICEGQLLDVVLSDVKSWVLVLSYKARAVLVRPVHCVVLAFTTK